MRTGIMWAIALTAALSLNVSSAQRPRRANIAVGALQGPEAARPSLQRVMATELRQAHGVRVTGRGRAAYVVSAAVTRFEERESPGRLELECEVSLIVSRRRGGAVRAVLSGRAAARGAPNDRLRDSVVRAAIRGALRPIAEAL